jgi:hypothetical protein
VGKRTIITTQRASRNGNRRGDYAGGGGLDLDSARLQAGGNKWCGTLLCERNNRGLSFIIFFFSQQVWDLRLEEFAKDVCVCCTLQGGVWGPPTTYSSPPRGG